MSRKPLIAGNWKMNGSRKDAETLAGGIAAATKNSQAEVLVCPPFVHLAAVASSITGSNVQLGAQNVSERGDGAFTGEISCSMLKDMACDYVIVGHSERRELYAEHSGLVVEKAKVAASGGISPIVCVGETLADRESGRTEQVIDEQLAPLFAHSAESYAGLVIAYEPVWAIGTGKTASPEQAQEVHAYIRSRLASWNGEAAAGMRLLYGGSVKPDNAKELFSMADVDGGLVGGASLKVESFEAICNAV